jgi:hypothetical protein
MTFNNKILPVALVAALLGGTVGAFVMRPNKPVEVAQATPVTRSNFDAGTNATTDQTVPASAKDNVAAADNLNLSEGEMAAYREGFNDGVKAARENASLTSYDTAPATTRVVNRPVTRTRYVRSGNSSSRRVYYDYGQQPRGRSFWQKHRDKLTVAMGAGGGALIGGLVGGKMGAAIGALAGGGGSALYTYKLRNRSRRY